MSDGLFRKIFTGGKWIVAIKKDNEEVYRTISTDKYNWLADPFLFEREGQVYLFVEYYDETLGHAVIAYYRVENGVATFGKRIIENKYHMSYPCVFTFNGELYMIPETSANKSVDLYKADEFPDKWTKYTTLLNEGFVDSTVHIINDELFLLTYKKNRDVWDLSLNSIDIDNKRIKEIDKTIYKTNVGRPAGLLFYENDQLYRPAQNCSKKYGESIILYKVNQISSEGYSEEFYREFTISEVKVDSHIDRIHTINHVGDICVIYGYMEKFDMLRPFKLIKRKYFMH